MYAVLVSYDIVDLSFHCVTCKNAHRFGCLASHKLTSAGAAATWRSHFAAGHCCTALYPIPAAESNSLSLCQFKVIHICFCLQQQINRMRPLPRKAEAWEKPKQAQNKEKASDNYTKFKWNAKPAFELPLFPLTPRAGHTSSSWEGRQISVLKCFIPMKQH